MVAAFGLFPAATALDRRWGYQLAAEATYKDVPLYSKHSEGIEALASVQAITPCAKEAGLFCPEEAEPVADFKYSLGVLTQRSGAKSSGQPDHASANGLHGNAATESLGEKSAVSLTRIEAAEILYRELDPAHSK